MDVTLPLHRFRCRLSAIVHESGNEHICLESDLHCPHVIGGLGGGGARGARPHYFCRFRYFSLKRFFSANYYITHWVLVPECQENAYLAL